MYSTFSPVIKASQAEQVICTLRNRIFRYFRVTGKYHFVSTLLKIVPDYNNTKHRTLGISPSEVMPENELELFTKINGKPVVPSVKKKLKVRDKVRVLLHRKGFQKSSEESWSPQIFSISCLRDTSPPFVHLEDYRGKEVDRAFYMEEVLVVTRDATQPWPVTKVLRKKKVSSQSFFLVHWFGYDKELDSWVPSSDVVKIRK
ncbi:uncharacterized protein LOC135371697 [Ornithodoros turicata]|uniref:uncharacterized protein LOC135371697 n=1 Tax=Ornithodoros turicata TaxID=34597 RepID=UPI0031392CFB